MSNSTLQDNSEGSDGEEECKDKEDGYHKYEQDRLLGRDSIFEKKNDLNDTNKKLDTAQKVENSTEVVTPFTLSN